MHVFFIVAGLLHATALAVIGFFVLFAASKAEGLVKRIGNILGAWLYILAALALIGWIVVGATAGAMLGRHMMGFHHPWGPSAWPANAAPPGNAAAPAAK